MSKIQDANRLVQSESQAAFRKRLRDSSAEDFIPSAANLDENFRRIKVDWKAIRDAGILTRARVDGPLSRQFRDIKRPLMAHAFGKKAIRLENSRLIMITSSLSGEGKTFVTLNLARSMAQGTDYSVLLVDADVAKPHTSELLGVPEETGLLDLLENPGSPPSSAILDTDFEGLSILPAGKPRPNATELLASLRMEKLVAALVSQDKNRIILLDSPPLLQTSEAKVLAGCVGQIILVVGADHTPKGAVAEALQLVGEYDVVNLILNKSSARANSVGYGYGYGGKSGDDHYSDQDYPETIADAAAEDQPESVVEKR
jgi:protein-tyrosine kinase